MRPNGCDVAAGGVAEEGKCSIGRVAGTISVTQKRPSASGRILVCGAGKERPSADTGIEVTACKAQERKQTHCCIVRACGAAKKRWSSFCSVATRIAAIRRRTHRESFWGKPKREAGKHESDK